MPLFVPIWSVGTDDGGSHPISRIQEWESRGIASILAKELNIPQPLPGENVYEALSPEQRRNLIAIMADSGMCANTTRHRFSCINFAEWEMIGINKLREQFIAEVNGNSIEQ